MLLATPAYGAAMVAPPETDWIMAVQVCKMFPKEIEDAIDRQVLHLTRDCRWLGVANSEGEPAVWRTKAACEAYEIPLREPFYEQARNCQEIPPH